MNREQEDRLLNACVEGPESGFWLEADSDLRFKYAGLARMLSCLDDQKHLDWSGLAVRMAGGMKMSDEAFQAWLNSNFVNPSRFLPMLRQRMVKRGS